MFGDVIKCGLRGEGRRDCEVDLSYGVKKKHMITLESIEFSFFLHINYTSLINDKKNYRLVFELENLVMRFF